MTSLLMSSPPITISHRLFPCRYSNSRDVVASSPSFPPRRQSTLESLLAGYSVFSLTWPASMQIYWNKRKRLHKKRVQLPQDWFGTQTWPPFLFWDTNMAAMTSCENTQYLNTFNLIPVHFGRRKIQIFPPPGEQDHLNAPPLGQQRQSNCVSAKSIN